MGKFFQNGEVDTLSKRFILKVLKFSHKRKNFVTILQNNDDKAFFVEHGVIPENQIRLIHGSGVDLKNFNYSKETPGTPLKLSFTSRMLREKGVLDVIKAAQILKEKYYNKLCFQLCGLIEEGPSAISKEELDELCDGNYIQYLGQRSDIRDLLINSAIVLLPSYYREGIPKSLIEATAIGRPIITTDSVGCRETVVNGLNGFLIPIKSPDKLAEKIEILANDTTLREKMGLESRKIAEQKFSINYVISEHFAIYSSFKY